MLITRFSAIGDVAMTVPVVYSVCRRYPNIRFVLATRPHTAAIFTDAPANLTVHPTDLKNANKGVTGLWRLCSQLRDKYMVGAVVDLHDVLRTKVMRAWFAMHGTPAVHIRKPREGRRRLLRDGYLGAPALQPQTERYAEAFAMAGFEVPALFDGLFGGRCKSDPTLFADITPAKAEGQKWIGVAPFAAHSGKIYPIEKMREVVERLSADPTVRIFLFGGGDAEKTVLEGWAKAMPRVQSLAGQRHGFAKELALMNHLDAMLSMDSSNMHLAAIAGAPTVSVWGATHPACGFAPWNQPQSNMVQAAVDCRPCSVYGNKPCAHGDYRCLNAITPDMIVRRIQQILSKN